MTTFACVGECMIELSADREGRAVRGFGGDTLNTAIYLARLGCHVDYITALGDDPFSDEMVEAWQAEGVGITRVLRVAGKLPGLYAIKTNEAGERRFYYWRENSAARMLIDLPEAETLLQGLASYGTVYLSGITLSLYSDSNRERLLDALCVARASGTRIAFDSNYRPRGWPDASSARKAFESAFDVSDIVLASVDDLAPLYGDDDPSVLADRITTSELILKLASPACVVRADNKTETIVAEPVMNVIDTTAAGDSFSAAYLAARANGSDPFMAAHAGHRLAGAVVGHRGAIIPEPAMPDDVIAKVQR